MKSGHDTFYIDEMQTFPLGVQLEKTQYDPTAQPTSEQVLLQLESWMLGMVAKDLRIDLT